MRALRIAWAVAGLFALSAAAETPKQHLTPAVLAVQKVRLEPPGRAPRQLAAHVLGGVAFWVV